MDSKRFEGVRLSPPIMPGLVPGIHVFGTIGKQDVDGRAKPDHDLRNCELLIIDLDVPGLGLALPFAKAAPGN
jgi:hypothetical protein